MRTNDSVWARSLGSLAIAVVATGLFAGRAAAETTVHLVAAPVTKPVTLPSGATPVDFAYAVHTEVGNRCIGSRVNGRLVALERACSEWNSRR